LQDISLFSSDNYEERLFSIFEKEISQKIELKSYVIFSGGIARGKMQGPGSFIYEDGSFYVGSFYEGIRDGHGILFYTDGSVFKGIWAKGDIKGIGIYKRKTKTLSLEYLKRTNLRDLK